MSELPKLGSISFCPKCTCLADFTKTKQEYMFEKHLSGQEILDIHCMNVKPTEIIEFILKTCGRCGYKWKEACANT